MSYPTFGERIVPGVPRNWMTLLTSDSNVQEVLTERSNDNSPTLSMPRWQADAAMRAVFVQVGLTSRDLSPSPWVDVVVLATEGGWVTISDWWPELTCSRIKPPLLRFFRKITSLTSSHKRQIPFIFIDTANIKHDTRCSITIPRHSNRELGAAQSDHQPNRHLSETGARAQPLSLRLNKHP